MADSVIDAIKVIKGASESGGGKSGFSLSSLLSSAGKVGSLLSGVGAVGNFAAGLVGGFMQNKQAEKAQAYQEQWAERLYQDQKQQQTIQNKLTAENQAMNRAAQYYSQQMALRNEARIDQDRWYQRMQNASNKYAEILNKSRSLRKENAAALQNR